MIPRALVPEKPIVYGHYIIHETLSPGMLEKGRAVGTLLWTKYYLDFGVFGVFGAAALSGVIAKTVYYYFLTHQYNPFAFMIMVQVSVITIFNYANLFMVFILLIIFSWWLRVWGAYNRKRIVAC